MSGPVVLTIRDGVGHVTLDRPDRGNPFDVEFCTELSRVATTCDESRDVRAVLIDAAGPYFTVGADLKTMTRDRDDLPVFIKNATVGLHSAISRFARMDAPVIVAVHALAVGGGVALSAAADFCLAARSARFYAAYTGIGLLCDGGGSTFLPRRIGARRTAEFLMRNQTWTAAQAHERGLVSDVVDDGELPGAALALAAELAQGPTRSFGEIKNLLLSTWEQPIEAQMELEARAMARACRTEDAWAGVTEVAARRVPRFQGR
ncbi:enoyl-CoA hydratase /trans-2,cis-3 decenoyl-[acyl-carrier-protein] isomerase [Pseudonocardia sediminis]|uniref:Enoyl-CoA hydratase /trans-2,cis-3 decenoyl-[acyl-carrier-protein] isomerase n=1 Tax=Pseudonocardia sediminis TaxID=1397368 RepID=A0A4Q7UXH4_PSEST|nr:enoyl-CoA hydratase/isomerase family protein [Pseudonocardia sediminis]RZT86722.1 enoyl-CoA hydratase /trans-2,cis-3 decenoyl-[acyl-carrier-protein] isomerase [Pseudonocardia sediminis]